MTKLYGSLEAGGTKFVCAVGNEQFEVIEKEHPLDPGLSELVRSGQAHRQIVLRQPADIHQGNVGLERLIER